MIHYGATEVMLPGPNHLLNMRWLKNSFELMVFFLTLLHAFA